MAQRLTVLTQPLSQAAETEQGDGEFDRVSGLPLVLARPLIGRDRLGRLVQRLTHITDVMLDNTGKLRSEERRVGKERIPMMAQRHTIMNQPLSQAAATEKRGGEIDRVRRLRLSITRPLTSINPL